MPDPGVELNEDFAETIIHKKYIYNPRCLLLALLLMFIKCLCHEVKKKSQVKQRNTTSLFIILSMRSLMLIPNDNAQSEMETKQIDYQEIRFIPH